MAWIESDVNLGDHPKVTELCFVLDIKKHEAIGYLHLLWHFTMKYAWRDGDLRRFTPRILCGAVGWDKDEATFIRALHDTGWLDNGSMVVHDWLDYSGKLVKDRLYNELRRKTSFNAVNLRKTTATLPYPTLPYPTKGVKSGTRFEKPTATQVAEYGKTLSFEIDGNAFVDYYQAKGWVVGRSPMRDWKAAVRTWKKRQLENGAKEEGVWKNEIMEQIKSKTQSAVSKT